MKKTLQWLLGSCLIGLCIAASPLQSAYAQTTPSPSLTNVPILPKYMVLGVVYAPPGSSSSVTYGNSTMVGSSVAIGTVSGSSHSVTTSTTVGGNIFGFGAKKTTSTTDGWSTTAGLENTVNIQSTQGNSISTLGPISSSLGVNHDNDVIYILLNPMITTTIDYTVSTSNQMNISDIKWSGMWSNGCDLTSANDSPTFYQLLTGCDPNQYPYPDIVGIPVWCLKNPYFPGQGCAQWLAYTSRAWDDSYWGPVSSSQSSANPYPANPAGLTLRDFTDILHADPFVALNGSSLPSCNNFGPNLDPNDQLCSSSQYRFQPYGTVEYPEPGPNGLPSTYSGNFIYSSGNQTTKTATDTHTTETSTSTTVGFNNSLGLGLPGGLSIEAAGFEASYSFGSGNSTSLENSNVTSNQTQNNYTAAYSITGPQLSDNYTGPATYNVYLDSVYGTFAFYSDLEPKITLGNIGVSPTSLTFASTVINQSSAAQTVTLTNSSQYTLTMVWPAVTFSDPGFQIVQDGTDHCSNQLLQPGATCTLHVSFSPVASDAPNPVTLVNEPVQATMIAAGTENASSYQNVLVTAQAAVTGTVGGSSTQGASLIANGSPVTQGNPVPNVYVFPIDVISNTAPTQVFTFTNYYTGGVTLQPQAGQSSPVSLTDTSDFTVLSNTCTAGIQIALSGTCTFTLRSQPQVPPGYQTSYNTAISVSGSTSTSLGITPLAVAGAAGTSMPGLVLSPSRLVLSSDMDCYQDVDGGGNECLVMGNDGTITVTNATNTAVSLQVNLVSSTGTGVFAGDYFLPCTTGTLAVGGSCYLYFDKPNESDPATGYTNLDNKYSITVTGQPAYTTQFEVQETSAPYTLCGGTYSSCYWLDAISITANASSSSSTTVIAGGTAQYTFNIAPGSKGYLNTVSFIATGLPAGATASFSPATLAANAGAQTVILSIQTAVAHASLAQPKSWLHASPILLGLLLLPLTAMRRFRRSPHKFSRLLTLMLSLTAGIAVIGGVVGCGSGVAGAGSTSHTYTITVTATNGSIKPSITFPLIVQ